MTPLWLAYCYNSHWFWSETRPFSEHWYWPSVLLSPLQTCCCIVATTISILLLHYNYLFFFCSSNHEKKNEWVYLDFFFSFSSLSTNNEAEKLAFTCWSSSTRASQLPTPERWVTLFQVLYWWGLIIAQIQFTCPSGENGLFLTSLWHLVNQVFPGRADVTVPPPGPLYDLWRKRFIFPTCVSSWYRCPEDLSKRSLRIGLRFQACVRNQISSSSAGRGGHFAPLLIWRLNWQPPSSITGLLASFHPFCPPHLMSKWHSKKRGPGRKWSQRTEGGGEMSKSIQRPSRSYRCLGNRTFDGTLGPERSCQSVGSTLLQSASATTLTIAL